MIHFIRILNHVLLLEVVLLGLLRLVDTEAIIVSLRVLLVRFCLELGLLLALNCIPIFI